MPALTAATWHSFGVDRHLPKSALRVCSRAALPAAGSRLPRDRPLCRHLRGQAQAAEKRGSGDGAAKGAAPPGETAVRDDDHCDLLVAGAPAQEEQAGAASPNGGKAEPLEGEFYAPTEDDEIKGLLICRTQAGNLSQPVSSRMPVRIAVSRISALAR